MEAMFFAFRMIRTALIRVTAVGITTLFGEGARQGQANFFRAAYDDPPSLIVLVITDSII